MNKKTLFFLINIPIWILILSFVYIIGFRRYLNPPEGFNPIGLSFILFYSFTILSWLISSFYIFYSYLVPKYWKKDKKKIFVINAAIAILIIEPIFLFIAYNIPAHFIFKLDTFSLHTQLLFSSWILISSSTLLTGIIGISCRLIYNSFKNKESRKDLENKNLQSELNTLKSKLNPHLLFNSINNIDTLIQTNPELASTLLSKLSDLLRYVIYDTEEESISINKEISNLNRYIDLEKIRLTNPDCVTFTTKIINDIFIPPMLFFPFVENGFKHSNLNKDGQKLKISILENNNKLYFECINTVMTKPKNENNSGVGLNISKKRLELLFPNKYELRIKQENNEFCITLQIDLDR